MTTITHDIMENKESLSIFLFRNFSSIVTAATIIGGAFIVVYKVNDFQPTVVQVQDLRVQMAEVAANQKTLIKQQEATNKLLDEIRGDIKTLLARK